MVINGLSLYPQVDDSCGSLRLVFLLFPATREFFLGTPPPKKTSKFQFHNLYNKLLMQLKVFCT